MVRETPKELERREKREAAQEIARKNKLVIPQPPKKGN